MISSFELAAPRCVGAVDPDIFEVVKAEHARTGANPETTMLDRKTSAYYDTLVDYLEPVTQLLHEDCHRKPAIGYLEIAGTTGVAPGEPFVNSWARNWHTDKPRNRTDFEVIIASCQPTEFLSGKVEPKDYYFGFDELLRDLSAMPDKELLDQYDVKISRALPNVAMRYTGENAHRTAINEACHQVGRYILIAGYQT